LAFNKSKGQLSSLQKKREIPENTIPAFGLCSCPGKNLKQGRDGKPH